MTQAESKAAWTPGPWMAAAKPSSVVEWPVVARPYGRLICNLAHVSPSAERSQAPEVQAFYAETSANARLIAAAPDLAEALRRILPHCKWPAENGTLYDTRTRLDHIATIVKSALAKLEP